MSWSYSKFTHSYWTDKRFRSLASSDARFLLLYFMLTPHQNSSGCYRIPVGYATADLNWSAERYQAVRVELIEAGMILYDDETSEIFIVDWFTHNPAMNDKHAKGCKREISNIESECLREAAETAFIKVEETREPDKPKWKGRTDNSPTPALSRLLNPFNRV